MTMTETETRPAVEPGKARLLHTMLRVKDLDKSLHFYTELLGMKLLRKRDYPEARAGDGSDRQQPGLPRLDREQCRGRGARVSQHVCRRAPFHRVRPGLGEP